MRDGLSLLDQGIAFGGGAITAAQTLQMLGTIDHGRVIEIVRALADGDGAAVLASVADLDAAAADYGAALDDIMAALQQMAVQQLVGKQSSAEQDSEITDLAKKLSPEDTQLFYQIAVNGRRDLSVCRDERMSFEMTLLRMLAFRPDDGEVRTTTAVQGAGAAMRRPAGAAAASTTAIGEWPALIQAAGLRGAVRNLADHCELGADSRPGHIELVLASDKANFNTVQLRGRLQDALTAHLGSQVKLVIKEGEPLGATPAEIRRASEDDKMRRTREAIESDPNIQAVQAAFDAVLEPDSIQPPATEEH
jgi:DNA polymerase-3 subunit gamma/tau